MAELREPPGPENQQNDTKDDQMLEGKSKHGSGMYQSPCRGSIVLARAARRALFFVALCWAWGFSLGQRGQGGPKAWADEITPRGANTYQILTGDDIDGDRTHWDQLYRKKGYLFGTEPAAFLKEVLARIPRGKALDIAMGEGRNAVFLGRSGFAVEGVDLSSVALRKARKLAQQGGVKIRTIQADLNTYTIKPESFGLIININYLQRSLIPQIRRGLRKGGFVVFESYTVDQLRNPGGEEFRRDYLLGRGELRELFKDFEILEYRETNDGKDALASLLARKP
jgi:tellurite methyltransferase